MKRLPENFRRRGFEYTLVERTDHGFCYRLERTAADGSGVFVAGYEVFRRRIQKAGSFLRGGVLVETVEKERLPPDSAFGSWAWTFMRPRLALEKLGTLSETRSPKKR